MGPVEVAPRRFVPGDKKPSIPLCRACEGRYFRRELVLLAVSVGVGAVLGCGCGWLVGLLGYGSRLAASLILSFVLSCVGMYLLPAVYASPHRIRLADARRIVFRIRFANRRYMDALILAVRGQGATQDQSAGWPMAPAIAGATAEPDQS